MVVIVKISYQDDSYGSRSMEIMTCKSIFTAKQMVANTLKNEFGEFKKYSLKNIAEELSDLNATWDEEDLTFSWMDNGKGEEYIIKKISQSDYNKFQ
jgi:hypothetical protein